jgi:hypothetical protein
MASFRIRQKIEATGGLELNDGTNVTKLLIGSGCVTSPPYANQTSGSGNSCPMTVPGAATGCKVFITATSLPNGLLIGGGIAGTDKIDVFFTTTGCVAINAAAVTVDYIVVGR